MQLEMFIALTPYLLIAGAFSLVLLKSLGAPRAASRAYAALYLALSFAAAVLVYAGARERGVLAYPLGGFPPPIGILYVVDGLSALLGVLITALFLALYPLLPSFNIKVDEYFLALYLGLEAGMLGIAYTGDIFNMFVMMEVMLISAYGLIAMARNAGAYLATFRYMIVGGAGGLLFFAGAVLIYFAAGSLNIGHLGAMFDGVNAGYAGQAADARAAILLFMSLLFWGLAIDEALAPFHFWLPSAYSSASPVVASLLAGLGEGVAFYALMRIAYTITGHMPAPLGLFLGALGAITILVGGAGMAYTRKLTEMVAYSVVLDAGYMAIALSLGPAGVPVAISYIIAHMIVKPLLFLTAGWARDSAGSDSLDALRGALRGSRALQAGFLVGASAVIGIPPTVLFVAKLQAYVAALGRVGESPLYVGALAAMVIGSALALASFLKAISVVILSPPAGAPRRAPRSLEIYVIALAALVIALGLLYPLLLEGLVRGASDALISGRDAYIGRVLQMISR